MQVLLAKRKQATNKETITTCLQSKWNAQGTRKKKQQKIKTGVKYKFSTVLQMAFGHQMQMRALQLANLQLCCQKTCQQ